ANTADARIFFRPIETVEALDDATLQIHLKEPSADFLMVLAGYRLDSVVASPTAVQRWGKDYKFHPVGAGPYKFVAWTPGQQVILEKNEHYFKPGLPYLDRIVLKTMRDATTRVGGGAHRRACLRHLDPFGNGAGAGARARGAGDDQSHV